jgi:substrate-binding family protein
MKKFIASLIVASSTVLITPPTTQAKIVIGMPGPMTGGMAWFGEQMEQGTAMKIAELNAAGGVLGQQIELLIVDDYCNPEQAIAAAHKLVEARVDAVIGHACSGAAIAAEKISIKGGSPAPYRRWGIQVDGAGISERVSLFRSRFRGGGRGRGLPGRALGRA